MQSKGSFARRPEHPYRVASLASLSEELRHLAGQALPQAETVSVIYVVPAQILSRDWTGLGGFHQVPEQALLFTSHGVAHVQAGAPEAGPGQAQYLPGEKLFYARLIMVLVYGRIELFGAIDGNQTQIVVEYNSVSQELLQPEFYKLLRLAWQPARADRPEKNETSPLLNSLELKSTKFCSGLRSYCLQPDERLLNYVYQPLLYKKKFGAGKRPVVPGSLLALTNRQLILVEEGLTSATSYGYFFTYCPRANVSDITRTPNETLDLNVPLQDAWIHLERDRVTVDRRIVLEAPNAQAAQSLWANDTTRIHDSPVPIVTNILTNR